MFIIVSDCGVTRSTSARHCDVVAKDGPTAAISHLQHKTHNFGVTLLANNARQLFNVKK